MTESKVSKLLGIIRNDRETLIPLLKTLIEDVERGDDEVKKKRLTKLMKMSLNAEIEGKGGKRVKFAVGTQESPQKGDINVSTRGRATRTPEDDRKRFVKFLINEVDFCRAAVERVYPPLQGCGDRDVNYAGVSTYTGAQLYDEVLLRDLARYLIAGDKNGFFAKLKIWEKYHDDDVDGRGWKKLGYEKPWFAPSTGIMIKLMIQQADYLPELSPSDDGEPPFVSISELCSTAC